MVTQQPKDGHPPEIIQTGNGIIWGNYCHIDFENGVIVKIYKSQVDPILVGGRLRHPQTKMGISSGPFCAEIYKFYKYVR